MVEYGKYSNDLYELQASRYYIHLHNVALYYKKDKSLGVVCIAMA